MGCIAFRRELTGGLTYKATIADDPEIASTSLSVSQHFGLAGPSTVQLIKTAAGPVVFEINPRCSSSTVMRAFFGFNEPELVVRSMVLGERVEPRGANRGMALRLWDEFYPDPAGVSELARSSSSGRMQYEYGIAPSLLRADRQPAGD